MTILVMCDDGKTFVKLDSKVFAQSAYDNDVNLYGFLESCESFCNSSTSDIQDVNQWRNEAIRHYIEMNSVDVPTEPNKIK